MIRTRIFAWFIPFVLLATAGIANATTSITPKASGASFTMDFCLDSVTGNIRQCMYLMDPATALPISPFPAGGSIGNTAFIANAGTNLNTSLLALESGNLATLVTDAGALTETAPASDTASSGLNGRLQRVAQRLTSLIALQPTSLGQKAMTASFPVVLSSDQSVLPISAASLPLPTLAATSTKQSDGTQKTQIVDGAGAVIASTSNNLNVQCANCTGTGVSAADEASFTAGTSLFASGGGFFQTTATNNALTNLQQGAFQVTATRSLFTNLRNAAGTEVGTAAAPLRTDPVGTTTQPVSVASLPLPAGAATAALQPTNAAQGSTTSGQTGHLIMGAVTTAAPPYTTAQTSPLSLDTSGALRVTGSTAAAIVDTVGTLGALGALNATASVAINGQGGAGMFLAAGTLIGTLTPEISLDGGTTWRSTYFYDPSVPDAFSTIVFASANPVTSLSIQTAGGVSNVRVRVSAYTSGTANATLRATTAMSDPLAIAQGSPTIGNVGALIQGAVTTTSPPYTTAQTSPLSLTPSGALRVDATSGSLSTFILQPAASDNHQNITTVASQVSHISVYNNSAAVNYLRLYNAGAGFNGCNSATNLKHKIQIPANTSVGGVVEDFASGLAFPTGIAICVTSGYANTDVTAATAAAMDINIDYKSPL